LVVERRRNESEEWGQSEVGESGPIADIDLEQSNVRFGEKQTSAQNSLGFLLIEFLTILALTDRTCRNTPPPGSVYAQ
jgi:hypothetical protein